MTRVLFLKMETVQHVVGVCCGLTAASRGDERSRICQHRLKKKKKKGNLEFWLWNKMENEVIKKRIETRQATNVRWRALRDRQRSASSWRQPQEEAPSSLDQSMSHDAIFISFYRQCLTTTSEPLCQMVSNILSSTEEPILRPSMLWTECKGQMFKFIQRAQIHLCCFMLGASNLLRPLPSSHLSALQKSNNQFMGVFCRTCSNQSWNLLQLPLRTGVNVAKTQTGMRQESWVIPQIDRTDAEMFLPASGCSCGQI